MAFSDAIKYNKIRAMKGLPVGAIVPWASDQGEIPVGWTVCNGSTISTLTYPILFSVIGNTYGGTAGSTFKLPPLTSGGPAIVDQFRGHYGYLTHPDRKDTTKGYNEAHIPTSTSVSDDPYWDIVGKGTNGDEGSNQQTFWISTMDLVGVEKKTNVKFQALYDDIEVRDGSYFFSANYNEVELGVKELPVHTHGDPSTDATSYERDGRTAIRCDGGKREAECNISCQASAAYRVAAKPAVHVRVSMGDNQSHLKDNFVFTDGRTGWTSDGGGGTFQATSLYAETVAGLYRDGEGRCSNNMNCGNDVLFTSRSHTTTVSGAGHVHAPNNYNMEGKYQVISPGLRTNIKLNTVRINNTPGVNYGTINVETATPSLEMLYIIRAF